MDSLICVGDAHLHRAGPEIDRFVRFLDFVEQQRAPLYILGDLFNLWYGSERLTMPYQREVIDRLRELRAGGTPVYYTEGNRDFHLGQLTGDAFTDVAEYAAHAELAGRRFHFSHGDLVNRDDHAYLRWRPFFKSRTVLRILENLPAGGGMKVAESLERRMRGMNMEHKTYIPESILIDFGREQVRDGYDIMVLGHFHDRRIVDVEQGDRRGRVYVLPDWQTAHSYLVFNGASEGEFVRFAD